MHTINVGILLSVLVKLIYIGILQLSYAHTIAVGRMDKSTTKRNIEQDKKCIIYGPYLELFNLTKVDSCFYRSVDIWEPLNELLIKQNGTYDCVNSIIQTLSALWNTQPFVNNTPPNDCSCTEDWFHLPYQNISYNSKTSSSRPSSHPTITSTTTKMTTHTSTLASTMTIHPTTHHTTVASHSITHPTTVASHSTTHPTTTASHSTTHHSTGASHPTSHPTTMSSTTTKLITLTSTLHPTSLSSTSKPTPHSTTTVLSVTIAPPPRRSVRRQVVSELVTRNTNCLSEDLGFKELYEMFYVHMDPQYPSEIIHYARSLSHHTVWKLLLSVENNCRKLLIKDLADTYGSNHFQANYTCHPGHVSTVTTTKTSTTMPTTSVKTTAVHTTHQNISTQTSGHGSTVTTTKTSTTMPSTSQKTTAVHTTHQNMSTHTTGHGSTVTTTKTSTTMPTTSVKTTAVHTTHQNMSTHTTGHVSTVTTTKTSTTMPTTSVKTTAVHTTHQNMSTHTTGHVSTVTTTKTSTTMPTTSVKTTAVHTTHQNMSTHTTAVTTHSSSSVAPTTTPVVTISATSPAATAVSCDVSQLTYGIEHEVIQSPSTNCPSKVFQSEQVPLAYCTIPPIYIAWRPGPKVIDTCQSLPNYTAIATFTSGTYNPYVDIAGIFLGCIDDNTAFKAVIALCNLKMTIENVTQDNSIFFHLPETYNVITS